MTGLWMEQALADEAGGSPAPSLEGAVDADVCVVGGGFTGLWTALRVKEQEPSASVVLLEADICGGAASGRNGGFALSWWPKVETLIERVGHEEALRLGHASEDAIDELERFCTGEGVDAEVCRGGWLWTATSAAQARAWTGAVSTCASLGVTPFEELSGIEVEERLGSPAHVGAVYERSAATVQPARLARGLRDAARRRGVRIYEQSAMTSLDRGRGIVHTADGLVRSRAVVLAMNAWLAQVRELARAVVPLSSDVVATEPIPELLELMGWTGGESVSNSRLMVDYYRTTKDGRIVFGRGGGGLAFRGRFGSGWDHHSGRSAQTAAALRRLVPAAREAKITHSWGGAVDRSHDGLPFFGRLKGGVPIVYGVGLSGNGVAPSVIAGRILASLALERRDEWSQCGLADGIPSRFPAEPVRFVGGLLVREAVRHKEGREDDGLRVNGVVRRLAAFAPSGFFKVTDEDRRGSPNGAPLAARGEKR
jgi:glycine/D-amino acid oxidase-like deaminating enzyme